MTPPFRAEQIGSLLRPQELLGIRSASGQNASYIGKAPKEVEVLTQTAIASVVKEQLAHSIRPITSGEYERHIFYSGFFERLQGFQIFPQIPMPDGFRTNIPTVTTLLQRGIKTRPGVVAINKIRYLNSPYLREWEYLRSLLPREQWRECKLTIPSITWQHMHLAQNTAYDPSTYSSDREYFTDLAQAYRKEFQTLYDAGLRSIQIDDPAMTFFLTEEFRSGCETDGVNPDTLLDLYLWAHNLCLSQRPADLHVGIHLCRGNMPRSTHVVSGSYEPIAQQLFTSLDYDTFYLEYESDRAGDFQPLRHLPVGKNVVLGVVSTKSPELETLKELAGRVTKAADIIAQGQGRGRDEVLRTVLGVSPQCGFSSVSEGGAEEMTAERMWEKLKLVRDLAGRVWPGGQVGVVQE